MVLLFTKFANLKHQKKKGVVCMLILVVLLSVATAIAWSMVDLQDQTKPTIAKRVKRLTYRFACFWVAVFIGVFAIGVTAWGLEFSYYLMQILSNSITMNLP